jgi:hypothetical protein
MKIMMGFTEAFVPWVGCLHHIQKDQIGWQRCSDRDRKTAQIERRVKTFK